MNAHDGHPNYEADNCPRCGTAQARMGVMDPPAARDDQCAVHLSAMCSHEWGVGDGFESFQAAEDGPVTTNIDGAEVVPVRPMNAGNVIRTTPASAGCWIDGHWGQYAIARMIQIAAEHGYEDRAPVELDAVRAARQHLASMGPSSNEELTDAQYEDMMWAADGVELWLNENVAPEGYSFSWEDGEFFLNAEEAEPMQFVEEI